MGRIARTAAMVIGLTATVAAEPPAVKIELANGTLREQRTKIRLQRLLTTQDLKKFAFTNRVVIDEHAIDHAFPVITLNAQFANSSDDLISSYIHEQLHWHMHDMEDRQRSAVDELRRLYPKVPVGLPQGDESEAGTYGHLVDCYLEMIADRALFGPERTKVVLTNKNHYTWVYSTVMRDEEKIAGIVNRYQLRVK